MRRAVATVATLCGLFVEPAMAECRLALALGLDVSGSVDAEEYRLQLFGLAAALEDPDVTAALLAAPGHPVSLAVFEWSSTSYQDLFVGWTDLDSREKIAGVAARIRERRRTPAPQATGLGEALLFGNALLDGRADCWDHTLDISADGRNNDWPEPKRLRREGRLGDHRVNVMAVATSALGAGAETHPGGARDLAGYFRAEIIHGPDAFVELAMGYADYARAMKRKLLREVATFPLGAAPDLTPHRHTALDIEGQRPRSPAIPAIGVDAKVTAE